MSDENQEKEQEKEQGKEQEKEKPKSKKGLLVEDRQALEVSTPEGDRIIKTPDRQKTIQELKESDQKPLHNHEETLND